jgi:hypothetical protein
MLRRRVQISGINKPFRWGKGSKRTSPQLVTMHAQFFQLSFRYPPQTAAANSSSISETKQRLHFHQLAADLF